MSTSTLDDDDGVEYVVSECLLCELVARRPRAKDGLMHCVSCDMMWREPPQAHAA